jgi:AraC-like DNA-binding protein
MKQMLAYEPAETVQSVADRFGFPDQASFCRYFKRETGLSPTEYRQSL